MANRSLILRIMAVFVLLLSTVGMASAAPVSGNIFTTDSACLGTNVNIFNDKADVYLDGGPVKEGAAGLPDGSYYVQVTTPNGTVLGKTLAADVVVSGGEFEHCYRLVDILYTASSGFTVEGYDTSTNDGGVYKVWISMDPTFPPSASKTDNFKVNESGTEIIPGTLEVLKFYDANANGIRDEGEVLLDGWKISIVDGVDYIRYTPVSIQLEPDTYYVDEFMPIEGNWIRTAPAIVPVEVILEAGETEQVIFGNVCLGEGGGKTLGFWSNRNGGALIGADDLALLVGLNLRNADGTHFDPADYPAFRTWLLSANATNMANMLSAQLAAMALNVHNGFVSGDALIYSPELGFVTVNEVIAAANVSLGANGLTLAGDPDRAYQETLKNALDDANNNLNFVQADPCPYTFEE